MLEGQTASIWIPAYFNHPAAIGLNDKSLLAEGGAKHRKKINIKCDADFLMVGQSVCNW